MQDAEHDGSNQGDSDGESYGKEEVETSEEEADALSGVLPRCHEATWPA